MKRKRPFILLEVVIAVALSAIALGWLTSSSSKSLHKQMKALKEIDAERLIELSFFDALVDITKKPFFDQSNFIIEDEERKITAKQSVIKTDRSDVQWRTLTVTASYPKLKKSGSFKILLRADPQKD